MRTKRKFVEQVHFDTDRDEIHSVRDINEETNEDVGTDADYWEVETAEPEQPKNPISKGIDFVDFPHVSSK